MFYCNIIIRSDNFSDRNIIYYYFKTVVSMKQFHQVPTIKSIRIPKILFIISEYYFQHRGWGTELVPQHIAELYNKQMTLWEQVSRRSSLSALSLASTTPR